MAPTKEASTLLGGTPKDGSDYGSLPASPVDGLGSPIDSGGGGGGGGGNVDNGGISLAEAARDDPQDTALTAAEQAAWVIEELLRGQPIKSASDVGSSRSARTSYLRLRHSEPGQQLLVLALMVLSFLEPPSWCAHVGCPNAPHELSTYAMSGLQGWLSRTVGARLEGFLLGLLLAIAVFAMAFVQQPVVSRKRLQVKTVLLTLAAIDWAVAVFGGNWGWRVAAPLRVALTLVYFASLYDVASGLVSVLPSFASVFSMVCLFVLIAGWTAALLFHDLPGSSDIQVYYGSLLRGIYTMFAVLTTADFPLQMIDVYDANGFSAVFFVFVIVAGVVFLLGLVTATVYNVYTEHLRQWTANKARVHTDGLSVAYDLLRSNRGANIQGRPAGDKAAGGSDSGKGHGGGGTTSGASALTSGAPSPNASGMLSPNSSGMLSSATSGLLSSDSLQQACADGDAGGDVERGVRVGDSPPTSPPVGDGGASASGSGTAEGKDGQRCAGPSASPSDPAPDNELRPRHLRALFREMQKNETLTTTDLTRSDLVFKVLDDDGDNTLDLEEFVDLFDALELKFESLTRETLLQRRLPWLYRAPQFAALMDWVRADDSFCRTLNVIMILNMLVVMVETHLDLTHNDSAFSVVAFAVIELGFSLIYIVEVVLKLMAVGWRVYWRQFGNRFDLGVALLLLASALYVVISPSEQSTATVRIFMLLRLLRLLTLMADISHFRLLGRTVCVAGAVSLPLLTLLFLCIFLFSSLGVQLFGGLFWKGNPALDPAVNPSVAAFVENNFLVLNFNDVATGCLALFCAMVVGYLTELANAATVTSGTATSLIFFVSFYVCSVLIIGNVVFALLIDVLISTQERLSGEDASERGASVTQLSQRYGLRHVKVSHSGTTLTHERVFYQFFKENLDQI